MAKERKIYISEPLVSQTVTRYKKRKKASKKFPNFSNKDTSRRYIKEIEREREIGGKFEVIERSDGIRGEVVYLHEEGGGKGEGLERIHR